MLVESFLPLDRINRNIVECKGALMYGFNELGNGINRNIVECKAVSATIAGHASGGINRNIVECKEHREMGYSGLCWY